MYLLDREAITTGMIKIIWADEHGQSMWDNVAEPDTLEGLSLALGNYLSIPEIVAFRVVRGVLIVR